MALVEPRIDLSDAQALYYCLRCGAAYAREVDSCSTCAAGRPTARERVTDLMREAAPDAEGEQAWSDSLWGLAAEGRADHLSAVLDVLWREGVPFLLVDESGQALEPGAEGAIDLLAPPVPLKEIVREIEDGIVPQVPDHGDAAVPAPTEHAIKLISCADLYEANLVHARLDEVGIPYQDSRMSQQFGFTVGRLAKVDVYVTDSDLARARQAIDTAGLAEETGAGPLTVEQAEEEIEREQVRRKRQYTIARWFLYPTAFGFALAAPFALGVGPLDAVLHFAVGAALMAMAVWSHTNPRPAFLGAFLVASGAFVWALLADRPFLVVPGIICVLAMYFAYQSAVKADSAGGAAGSSGST